MSFERIKDTDTADVALYDKVNGMFDRVYSEEKTNCITEIPQDIKLELSNGTLTLKAGSKAYFPYGSGVFNAITTTTDVSITRTDSQDCLVWYYSDGRLGIFPKVLFYSGATAPTQYQFMYWYDTTENKCKITSNTGSTWTDGPSLPICVVETDGTKISAIKQVFNGFGYVGSTIFALPGVKGLIPNGRNADGTLRNIELVSDRVWTRTWESNPNYRDLSLAATGIGINTNTYKEEENFVYNSAGNKATDRFVFGKMEYSGSSPYNVTSFQVKTPFHAVDYNDFEKLDDEAVKTTGNQTITGVKGFTDQITRYVDFNASSARAISINDVNNKGKASIIPYYTSNIVYFRLLTENTTSGKQAYLDVTVNDNGDAFLDFRGTGTNKTVGFGNVSQVTVPTPTSATDNSTKAATTAWCTNSRKTGNGAGIPNYAAGVSVANNYTFTANGVIKLSMYWNGTKAQAYLDGVEVYYWSDDGNSHGTSYIIVKKGQKFTCSTGLEHCTFYPFL